MTDRESPFDARFIRRVQLVLARFGLGALTDGNVAFPWVVSLRCWLSYRLGVGQWVYSSEECQVCGGSAEDFDYHGERRGPKRYVCDTCAEGGW